MKVICQSCNATYAINDAAIPPKGARAQCPRCKHLQNVVRPAAPVPAVTSSTDLGAPPPLPSAPGPDPFADLGAPPPLPSAPVPDPFADLGAPPPPAAAPGSDPFAGLGPAAAPGSDPFAGLGAPPPRAAEPASDPFASLDLAGAAPAPAAPSAADPFADMFGAPPPRAPPANVAQPAVDPFASLDLGAPPAAPAPAPAPAADPFADLGVVPPPSVAAPAAAPVLGKCGTCGKALTDPFDAALASCEGCRAKETPLDASAPAPAPARTIEPLLPEAGRPPMTTGSRPLVVDGPKLPEGRPPAPSFKPVRRKSPVPWVVLAAVVVAGGGFAAWKLGYFGGRRVAATEIPPVLRARLGAWSLAFPEREGTAGEHLSKARAAMLLDRPADYRRAEAEFEKAAILAGTDRSRLASGVAGALEAYLLGRGDTRDPDIEPKLLPLLQAVASLEPHQYDVLRARAYAMAHEQPPQLEEAQRLAQKALEAAPPEGKAECLLALGALFIESAQQSLEYLDRAIAANPKLQRAYFLRGLASEKTGHYRQALTDFADRVKRDPGARDAALEIAKLHVAIGDAPAAHATLQKILANDPHAAAARLALAVVDYQVDHNLRGAAAELAKLLADVPGAGPLQPLDLRILVHAATVARESGDLDAASAHVARALAASPDDAPALFQSVLIALARHKPHDAHPALDTLLNQVARTPIDGLRVEPLAGRVAFAEGQPDQGATHFRNAVSNVRIDLRAAILGAALSIKAHRSAAAYELMKKAVEIDPLIEARHRGVTEYYESARSELAGAAGAFQDDHSSGLPIAYAGVVEFALGETGAAQRAFESALHLEPDTTVALAYLALMKLPRSPAAAKHMVDRAVAADRTSVLALYVAGRVKEAQKDPEGARELYRSVLRQAPSFTSASARIAALDAADGDKKSAEALLTRVVFADGQDTSARAALFALGY